ncbi:MAG: hypothetical protein WC551_01060 [Patescibacteria group bacterium]
MPNRSKCNDLRFWNRWRLAGAINAVPQALDADTHIIKAIERIKSVVAIGGKLYAKTPNALDKLSALLRQNGYIMRDERRRIDPMAEDGVVEEMEKKVRPLWYAQYPGFDHPLRPSMSILEAWHWAPLPQSPKLHERIIHAAGMVSHCDYYYQDGRRAFYDDHLEYMRLFVKHFTRLDLGEWDKMIGRADRSGPGMIRAIAKLCHPQAEIEDKPNIGNLLVGVSKMMSGKRLTEGEATAMRSAAADPTTREQFDSILESRPQRTR